jgi:ABC-type arginine transport system permease subunit
MVMFKGSPRAAVLAVEELLRVARLTGETTRNPLLMLTAAGVISLAMTAASDVLRARIEKRARRGFAEP